ncbi:MAG: hypothetical protein WBD74_00340 [Candidatus Aquilonibacter sp.]
MLAYYAILATIATTIALVAGASSNPSPTAYTFHLDAAMAMRHFPWLHFHVAGTGEYHRGQDYVVHLTQMPFFVRGHNEIDLSALDPSMWAKQFTVAHVTQHDGMTTFDLRERASESQDQNPLIEALVTLDAQQSTRDVVMRYAHGEIHLTLTLGDTQGYRLPATLTADIDMPGEALVAHANFSDYTILQSDQSV